jgi:membrane associated rhomboid family serine protease
MVIPIGTNRRVRYLPWVNYSLIAANVLIFVMTAQQVAMFGPALMRGIPLEVVREQLPVVRFYLWPNEPALYQFISYQFLHQDWMHLFFNMLFLWVFGNEVEERLGKLGYLAFYLAGGVVAAIAHALPEGAAPMLGASGSVAAVTGAYLALFPMAEITIFLFFLGAYEVPSIALILFKIVQDAVFQFLEIGNVAYTAHLAGYGYGFVLAMGLLLTRLLPRDNQDMLSLLKHRRRRREFQRLSRQGGYAWDLAQPTDPVTGEAKDLSPQQQAIMDKRTAIIAAAARQDLAEAARLYTELLRADPRQVLPQQAQLDVADHLMGRQQYDAAAAAYELMLAHYPAYHERDHVRLILGLVYARYLGQAARARDLLRDAMPGLTGDNRDLARQVLAECDKA